MKNKLQKLLKKINIIHHTCERLVGKRHTFCHRATIGVLIMIGGVAIVKTLGHHEEMLISAFGDLLGLSLHGIGLIPFVEALLEDTE